MRRSAALAPLSRDHHRALSVALALRRCEAQTAAAAAGRFLAFWAADGRGHFEIEEQVLVPALPDDAEWEAGCRRMVAEHAEIRARAQALEQDATVDACRDLGTRLDAHVRFEERELFVLLEERLDEPRLTALGREIEALEAAR